LGKSVLGDIADTARHESHATLSIQSIINLSVTSNSFEDVHYNFIERFAIKGKALKAFLLLNYSLYNFDFATDNNLHLLAHLKHIIVYCFSNC
jgi:hypothetical protein